MIRLGLILTLSFACAGCSPITRVRIPLVDPTEVVDVPNLHGTFTLAAANGRTKFVHIGTAGDRFPVGFLKVVFIDDESPSGLTALTWPAFVYTEKGNHFLHFPI